MRKTIASGLAVAIIGGLVVAILTGKATIFSSYLLRAVLWAWEQILWIGATLAAKYLTSGWVLLVMGLLALVGLLACLRLILEKWGQPPFKNYTEDRIEGLVWRWQWDIDKQAETFKTVNLTCFCPKCDTRLVWNGLEQYLLCEQCPRGYLEGLVSLERFKGKVNREIERRVRRNFLKLESS